MPINYTNYTTTYTMSTHTHAHICCLQLFEEMTDPTSDRRDAQDEPGTSCHSSN